MRYSRYVALMCLMAFQAQAQDISNFSQFFLNPYTLNPSYAGIEGRSALFLGYRKQWTTIQGAPTLANFSYHTSLSKRVNVGLNINNDKRGIINTSSILLTAGYTIPIDNSTFIRFGLSAGYGYNSVDWDKVGTFTDPALSTMLSKNSFLLGNAGISFHKSTFHAGIALPNIFQPIYLSDQSFTVTAIKPFQSVVLHASNRFYFSNDNYVFEPFLIYRLNNGLPSQFEAAAVVHLQHLVWVGASYKQQFGISGLAGLKLKNLFAVGFSYSIQNSGVNQLAAPSYEIQLGLLMGGKKKGVAAYSFVDTHKEKIHKKTPVEIAADKRKQLQIMDQKLAEDKRFKELQLAKEKAAKKQNQVVLPKKAETVVAKADSIRGGPRKKIVPDPLAEQQKVIIDPQHLEEQEKLKRIEVHAENPTEEHNDTIVHPHSDRHEFVKRGEHEEELEVGNYVIVGVFSSRANAASFVKGLTRMSFDAHFGFLTEKNHWDVYLFRSDDINEVRSERNKSRKLRIFRDAWLLTVHH